MSLLIALTLLLACGDKDDGSDDGGDDSGSCVAEEACQDACRSIYADAGCALRSPGQTTPELIDWCTEECEGAAATAGGLGDYDPDTLPSASTSVRLETCAQAQAWLDCIDRRSCEELEEGYCAPIR
ncbi:MAG: hypothetical protein H6742_18575 [Alphaproteobacteria bacterium]|nr:hypothetical protein [Alphaproteobacteria bacterium]